MSLNLNTLKENELRKFSYIETKEVLSELEKIRLHSLDGIDIIERVETYYSFVTLIKNRVDNHEFAELNGSDKKSEIKRLHITLDILLYTFKFSLDGNKLRKQMIKLDSQVQFTQKDYNDKKHELEAKVNVVEKSVKKFQSQVNDTEHTILTHVLTLMGVFTAVITIILSVATTSSAWLNNASGASAVIAFIVPNLVVIIAMVILLGIVLFHKEPTVVVISDDQQSCDNIANKTLKKARKIQVLTCAFVVIFMTILFFISYSEMKSSEDPHLRYIISPGMYRCFDVIEDSSGKNITYIEFEINNSNYIFPYDDELFHDGKLYFCEKHQRLE